MSLRDNQALQYMAALNAEEMRAKREQDRRQVIADLEREHTVKAHSWLQAKSIFKAGMSRQERRDATATYRKWLKTHPQNWKTEPHLWAYEILSRIESGECVNPLNEKMARVVLKKDAE